MDNLITKKKEKFYTWRVKRTIKSLAIANSNVKPKIPHIAIAFTKTGSNGVAKVVKLSLNS